MFFLRSIYNFFRKKRTTLAREGKDLTAEELKFLCSLEAVFKEKKVESITIPVTTFQSKIYYPSAFNLKCTPLKEVKMSRGEEICIQTLSKHYHKPFYRVRPDFLRNPKTGKNLELDCFNSELGIGCEYNGKQHYHYPSFPGDTKKAFVKRIKRDLYKIKTCKKIGVYLLIVPYTLKENEIASFILSSLPR